MEKKTSIAFFDFDGTIIRGDSFLSFLRFITSSFKLYSGLLINSPFIILFLLRIIKDSDLKIRICTHFFKGKPINELRKKAKIFGEELLPERIRNGALEKIRWHQGLNHQVVIVSASADLWLMPFCQKYNLDLIATTLEDNNGLLTGKLQGPNCKGFEKVVRIKQKYDLNNYDIIYAYGDSSGDKEMIQMADKGFYKPFHSPKK